MNDRGSMAADRLEALSLLLESVAQTLGAAYAAGETRDPSWSHIFTLPDGSHRIARFDVWQWKPTE